MSFNNDLMRREPLPPMQPPKALPPTVNTPQDKLPALRRAVVAAVAPTETNPTGCSVLLENRLPARSGFTMPAGSGTWLKAGATYINNTTTSGRAPWPGPFYNDPVTNKGGTWVLVDTVNMVVVQVLQGVSQSFPNSASLLVGTHVHTGAVDVNGNPMPQPVDLQNHTQNTIGTGQLPPAKPPSPTYARLYQYGDTDPHATTIKAFANLQGVLQDFETTTYPNNVPQDKSVGRIAWCIRRTQDSISGVNNASPIITGINGFGQTGNAAYTQANQPASGELVVASITATNGQITLAQGWAYVPGTTSIENNTYFAYKIWTGSEPLNVAVVADFQPAAGLGTGEITLYRITGYNRTTPFSTNIVRASAAGVANTPPSVTIPGNGYVPTQKSQLVIGNIETGDSNGQPIFTPTGGWVKDSLDSYRWYVAATRGETGVSFHFPSLTADAVTPIPGTFALDATLDGNGINLMMIAVNAAAPDGTSGGTVYPWTIYAETNLLGLPTPPALQRADFSYGAVSTGVAYDFGLAYVNTGGVLSDITAFAVNYVARDIKIPSQYMLGFVAYVPHVLPGIPQIGNSPAVPPITALPSETGLTSTIQVGFQVDNQPTDGSLSRIALWYRQSNHSTGFRSAGPTVQGSYDGWSYYGSVAAAGFGQPLSNLPILGSYAFVFTDLSNGVTYDFAMSAEDAQGDETQIVPITSTTQPTPVAPPGLANGSANLVPDSDFAAAGPFSTGSGGFSHTQVSTSDPLWHFHVINGNSVISTENGGIMQQDIAASGQLFYGISSPFDLLPNIKYTFSAYFDHDSQIVGTSGATGGPYCALIAPSTDGSIGTVYATSTHGTETVQGTYTNTTANPIRVAFLLSNDGCTIKQGGYYRGAKPMVSDSGSIAYVKGPTTPPGATQTTQAIAIAPAGTTQATNASSPTITSGSGAPTSGAPQGSIYMRTDSATNATAVYTQTNPSASTPNWRAVGGAVANVTLTSDFNTPAVGSSGTFAVSDASILAIGQYVQLPTGAHTYVGQITAIAGLNITATTVQ